MWRWLFLITLCIATRLWAAEVPGQIAVASAHPLATQAGIEILRAGGNAFDAAVAVSATIAVVEPAGSGMGGGGFWLLRHAGNTGAVVIDGRERAPLAATEDMYLDELGEAMPRASLDGPLSAAIPGQPAALVHIAERYGRLPLGQSLAPAIRAAREGFAVGPRYRRLAGMRVQALRASPAAAEIFLVDGDVPPLGHIVRQPDLAATLGAIAKQGRAGFYAGVVAQRMVEGVRAAGGIWTQGDLNEYTVVEREPIVGEYRGLRVTTVPPPSSGGVALLTMLNILAGYDLQSVGLTERRHLIVEAMRRAYRDRALYLGDPDFVGVPVQRLIHPFYADGLRAGIRTDRATPSSMLPGIEAPAGGSDTTHLSILDAEGNAVSATLSINYPFGSAFVPPGTGVLLNDEMDDFSIKPGVPNAYGLVGKQANAIAPGKRPLSSMTPTIVDSDKGVAIVGTPGGSRIITMVLHAVLGYAEGKDAARMVALPRYHHQFLPDAIQFEPNALNKDEQLGLGELGHDLKPINRAYGDMHVVVWDKRAHHVEAASDPRGEGEAMVSDVVPQKSVQGKVVNELVELVGRKVVTSGRLSAVSRFER